MSTIADREAWRTGKPLSPPATRQPEPIFWIVLVAVAAVMIAAAVVGASYGLQVPSETFFVGP